MDDSLRASSLEITDEAMRELSTQAVALVTDYFKRVSEQRVFPDTSAEEIAGAFDNALPVEGEPLAKIIEDCRAVFNRSRHNGHPRFFGYVASPSTPVGAYADLIASTLNPNVTSWRSAPAATRIEQTVIKWLGGAIGYGEDAQGILTSGGSMANLNAIIVALRTGPQSDLARRGLWNAGAPLTLYASDETHFSIVKAAEIIGVGREQVRLIESDAQFRLDARSLRAFVESDRSKGLRPFCVVANAGTVSTGAIDPLAEVANVADEYGLWFHVDGAYGALGALDESKRKLFTGIERADSVSLDPHKWLYAPVDCGCLLFRDSARVRDAWSSSEADYVKIHEATDDESFAFWDYGVELSRRFRALKIWMMLRYYGSRRVTASITEDNALADALAQRVNAAEDFELLAPAVLSICCFRYVPPRVRARLEAADEEERAHLNAELDQLNARIMHKVQRGGRAYLSNANIKGRFALRACITNFRTTRADIRETLDIIRGEGRKV
ncbi:MAG: pyridoxal-dependent decarboxylase [Pyrinomonadaceae bacterium]